MNITNAQYVNEIGTSDVDHIFATVDGVEVIVPIDTNNTVYAEMMKQATAGTLTIADAD